MVHGEIHEEEGVVKRVYRGRGDTGPLLEGPWWGSQALRAVRLHLGSPDD